MIYYEKHGILVRTSEPTDVEDMKNNLRKTDIDEVWASHHHSPAEALRLSFEMSELCLTVLFRGTLVAMFGISPETLISDSATIWLLATDGFNAERLKCVRKSLIKECRNFIDMFLEECPVLYNHVDARNKSSIKWLRACGAEIEEAKPYGAENIPFHYFSFRRENAV
jgi:hypothetical protein